MSSDGCDRLALFRIHSSVSSRISWDSIWYGAHNNVFTPEPSVGLGTMHEHRLAAISRIDENSPVVHRVLGAQSPYPNTFDGFRG